MELGGSWRATLAEEALRRCAFDPSFDDSGWEEIPVPGHWRSTGAFSDSDGPLLYHRRFQSTPPAREARAWLRFEGIFYQGAVWLDGDYLGDTEGYFLPHTFEVTSLLAGRSEHLLAVEVACDPPADLRAKRSLTGVFQHWDCIEASWNPGGIWAPVAVELTGSVRIDTLGVVCVEADGQRATLAVEAGLDTFEACAVQVDTTVSTQGPAGGTAGARGGSVTSQHHTLAAGANRVRWTATVEKPSLWWPHALGDQPLYDVEVAVTPSGRDEPSHTRRLQTGLRQVRMRRFNMTVNGERIFLKGVNAGPASRALGDADASVLAGDVLAAKAAGLDLIRVHGHVSRRETYETADRAGMLVWQDLPLQWGYSGVRRQAVRQARGAVRLLGHHPSVAVWCGHNEPMAIEATGSPDPRAALRFVAAQVLPTRNKTFLDRALRRALEGADPSRPVVAHSGVLPHPAWGTDSHFYFGWYHGHERDLPRALARWPALARFVSEFGAQSVPDEAGFMDPQAWPDLDWARIEERHCLQYALLNRRVPVAEHETFESWKRATQLYQATLIRHHVETLRRLKYRPTGGFCAFLLADAQPAVSWSLLDHTRNAKPAWHALTAGCAPVAVIADRPARAYRAGQELRLDVHAVSDLRAPIAGATVTATLRSPGVHREWSWG
ncbi:MAG: glycoside hydrolase family 2 protein, partial [Acidimicrobiales bacterium]